MEKAERPPGTLGANTPHPMAFEARLYVSSLGKQKLFTQLEAMSSCAIEGNLTAEICGETLRRLLYNEPVSDRYLLGLAWFLKMTTTEVAK
ncbi:MAG: hypothetical protein JZU65_16225 [Chlorobium sp.]|nr:hypothetical protein [Chlorobium sp.]